MKKPDNDPGGDHKVPPASLADLEFHHFGLAVPAPQAAFRYLEALGYTVGNMVFDAAQKVYLAMRHHAVMPDVEVIWPGDDPSPIDRLLKRNGSMIYHICYEVADPATTVALFEAAGLEVALVSPPKPAPLFGGREVSFYVVEDFGLIELLCKATDQSRSATLEEQQR